MPTQKFVQIPDCVDKCDTTASMCMAFLKPPSNKGLLSTQAHRGFFGGGGGGVVCDALHTWRLEMRDRSQTPKVAHSGVIILHVFSPNQAIRDLLWLFVLLSKMLACVYVYLNCSYIRKSMFCIYVSSLVLPMSFVLVCVCVTSGGVGWLFFVGGMTYLNVCTIHICIHIWLLLCLHLLFHCMFRCVHADVLLHACLEQSNNGHARKDMANYLQVARPTFMQVFGDTTCFVTSFFCLA